MTAIGPGLPRSAGVDVPRLARLFRNTTTSYKYLFFLALLGEVERRGAAGGRWLPLRSLVVGMLVRAWHPSQFFRLSFGPADGIGGILREVGFAPGAAAAPGELERSLRREIAARADGARVERLLRYVPARLLRPFFDEDLRGEPDRTPALERRIAGLSRSLFEARRPLYRILGDEAIEVHPAWWAYLDWNLPVVRDWARWHWAAYLQRRNPNVPAVAAKLEAPARRAGLGRQRGFWRAVLDRERLACIYSGRPLGTSDFDLDHFLPWSFVAHDQLWNLIPALPGINAAKGARIPDASYLPALAEVHARALRVAREALGRRRFEAAAEDYLLGLRVDRVEELLRPAGLEPALADTIEPLRGLALRMGFPGPWRYEAPLQPGLAAVAEGPEKGGYGPR